MEPRGVILNKQQTQVAPKAPSARKELEQAQADIGTLSDALNVQQSALSHHGQTIDRIVNEMAARFSGIETAVLAMAEKLDMVSEGPNGEQMIKVEDDTGEEE